MSRILIVDDSEPSRIALQAILREEGYSELVAKGSAAEALQYLKSLGEDPNGLPVDLILMDVIMPEMDGIQAVQAIKKIIGMNDIPIVMVSVKDEEEKIERAFSSGAIDYISKPIKKMELLARVRSVLKLKAEMDRSQTQQKELEKLNRSLEKANKKLQRLSTTDGLTGIANRRYLDKALNHEWRRALRDKKPISLLMADIDFFKRYNDEYGHLAGDDCLTKVAGAMKAALNRPGDLIGRYGGEEFLVLLPGIDNRGAKRVAETMQENIHRLNLTHPASTVSDRVTISIGIATSLPERGSTPTSLIEMADGALYEAKQGGRNLIVEYKD